VQIGGFIGTLSSGILCDKIFHGRSDVSCLCYSLLFIPAILCIPTDPLTSASMSSYAMTLLGAALLGAAINGPKTLSGIALRTMMPPSSFGLGGGLLGVFAQGGVFCSGTGVGWLLQNYQWTYFVTVLLCASALSSMLLALMITLGRHPLPKIKLKVA
jgi:sugar phosphate permease